MPLVSTCWLSIWFRWLPPITVGETGCVLVFVLQDEDSWTHPVFYESGASESTLSASTRERCCILSSIRGGEGGRADRSSFSQSGSQISVSTPGALASPGNLEERQILRSPPPDKLNEKLRGGVRPSMPGPVLQAIAMPSRVWRPLSIIECLG